MCSDYVIDAAGFYIVYQIVLCYNVVDTCGTITRLTSSCDACDVTITSWYDRLKEE